MHGLHVHWRTALQGAVTHTVAVHDTVYAALRAHAVYALDAETGAEWWRFTSVERIVSHVAVDGVVYIGERRGIVHSLDEATGVERWRVACGDVIDHLWVNAGVLIVKCNRDVSDTFNASMSVHALDIRTGYSVWQRHWYGRASLAGSSFGDTYVASGSHCCAVEASTGATRWCVSVPPETTLIGTSNGTVYALASQSGQLLALDAATGQARWSQGDWNLTSVWVVAPPRTVDDVVVVGNQSGCFAFDVETGRERWRFVESNCDLLAVDNDTVYIGYKGAALVDRWAGGCIALDARTGTLRWQYQTDSGRVMSLVVAGERLLMRGVSRLYALDIRTGKEQWRCAANSVFTDGAPSDRLYIGMLGCAALDARTGHELWRHRVGGPVSVVTATDRVVYARSDEHAVLALNASSGAERWRFDTQDSPISTLRVADGQVYLGFEVPRDGRMYVCALDARTGVEHWRALPAGYSPGGLHLADGMVCSPVHTDATDDAPSRWLAVGLDGLSGDERWRLAISNPFFKLAAAGTLIFADTSLGGLEGVRNVSVLSAFDVHTLNQRWQLGLDGDIEAFWADADDNIFVQTTHAEHGSTCLAIDARTGNERWRTAVSKAWCFVGVRPPLVVLRTPDNRYAAFRISDGTEQWRLSPGAYSLSVSRDVVDEFNTRILVRDLYSVQALGPIDGRLSWRFSIGRYWRHSRPDGIPTCSRPATLNGEVYIGSSDGNVYALSPSPIKERWIFRTDGPIAVAPLVRGGVAYIGCMTGDGGGMLYAVTAGTGEEVWRSAIDYPLRSAPVLVDGTVFAEDRGGRLYALDATNGTVIWVFATSRALHHASRSRLAVDDGTVYLGSDYREVHAVDTGSGAERWRVMTNDSEFEDCVVGQPLEAGGAVYVGTEDGFLLCIDAASGDERWRFVANDSLLSTPIIENGYVLVGSHENVLYALDIGTGTEQWRFHAEPSAVPPYPRWVDGEEDQPLPLSYGPPEERGMSQPAIADGAVYIGADGGVMYALDLETGAERWRFATTGRVVSTPTVDGSRVYVGSSDHNVYALDTVTGTEQWRFATESCVIATPVVADGVMYVGSYDGHLYALEGWGTSDAPLHRDKQQSYLLKDRVVPPPYVSGADTKSPTREIV